MITCNLTWILLFDDFEEHISLLMFTITAKLYGGWFLEVRFSKGITNQWLYHQVVHQLFEVIQVSMLISASHPISMDLSQLWRDFVDQDKVVVFPFPLLLIEKQHQQLSIWNNELLWPKNTEHIRSLKIKYDTSTRPYQVVKIRLVIRWYD